MFYSYVLKSEIKDVLYKGSTQNIEERLKLHNKGMVKYTSRYMPWKVVLFEEFDTRAEAIKREKWYKSGVGREWINQEMLKRTI